MERKGLPNKNFLLAQVFFCKKKKCVDKNLPNFTFAKDVNHAIESLNISFICVPTPITKAKELLGWKPKVELKEGLSKRIEWFEEKEKES